jgi:hypothetical protein
MLYEEIEAWWGNTAQIGLGLPAQLSVNLHSNAYDFAEANIIKHITTNLQNKQEKIGWFCFSKKSTNYLKKTRRYEHQENQIVELRCSKKITSTV